MHRTGGIQIRHLLKCGLVVLGSALLAWPVAGLATEIKIAGDTIKVNEGGVCIGDGVIKLTPDVILPVLLCRDFGLQARHSMHHKNWKSHLARLARLASCTANHLSTNCQYRELPVHILRNGRTI